jgi:regulator of CtrA degradation
MNSGADYERAMPVDFLSRFTASRQFQDVFQEGMSLIEETANYLDGQGRQDVRGLDKTGSVAYASQSMRLTTRLMQLASWLLLQRAVSAGEISKEEAEQEKGRISLDDLGEAAVADGGPDMPETLQELVSRSLRLHERIVTLDVMIAERDETLLTGGAANQVNTHLDQIHKAFNIRRN